MFSELANVYAYQGLVEAPGTLAGARWSAWLAAWIWSPGYNAGLFLVPLLFPNGRLPSPRWRVLLVIILSLMLLQALLDMFRPGPMVLFDPHTATEVAITSNPLSLEILAPLLPLFGILYSGPVTFFPLLIAVAVSIILRYRRSEGIERYQLRWFMFAVAITPFVFALWVLGVEAGFPVVADIIAGIFLTAVPVAVCIAVMRYHLYEIDRIISRTVTYAVVTTVLAAVYMFVAVVPSTVFELESDLVVASATLAAAGMFVPVRKRAQAVVDRQFNRSRYDKVRVVEQFTGRLRDDVDLDSIARELHQTISTTVQPTHVSLWLGHSSRWLASGAPMSRSRQLDRGPHDPIALDTPRPT